MSGNVYLVGAGPGDPELITTRGLKLLKKADVVVYDRLVNIRLLDNVKNDCKIIYVGKTAKNHTKTQDEINEILFQEAKLGNNVVRLKGGDPYVFGRGGEEGEYLYDRGIYFEEVPGITSAIGGLAYAGIPITHRGIATSFHVITGHLKDGSEDLDWESLAKLKGTLVFLMGVGNLDRITEKLKEFGKNRDTKAALINWGTTVNQVVIEGNLDNIYEKSVKANIKPPSLIVIGDVIGLRDKLKFYERKPLFGENIIITRERKSSLETIEKFEELGANVISFPTIETIAIKPNKELDEEIRNLDKYNYIVFTSVNGVNIFFEKLFREGMDTRSLGGIKVAAVGPKTGKALEKYGVISDLIPNKYVSEELIDILEKEITEYDKILIPRAKISRPILVEQLKEICEVVELEIYDTLKTDKNKNYIENILKELDDFKLIFTSSSTFMNFLEIIGKENEELIKKGQIISIGPITSESIKYRGYEIYKEAEDYTIDGIIDILIREDK